METHGSMDTNESQTETTKWWIHKHEVSQQYGGPEEGGWHFTVGVPVEGWKFPESFYNEEHAYEVCRALNANEYLRREEEETYGFTSVLSYRSDHYCFSVEDYEEPKVFPETRPHYE